MIISCHTTQLLQERPQNNLSLTALTVICQSAWVCACVRVCAPVRVCARVCVRLWARHDLWFLIVYHVHCVPVLCYAFPGIVWMMMERERERTKLTEDSSCWNRLSVEPERDLREDDGHDAWQVCLDHKVAYFPLQVEMGCHDNVLAWTENKTGLRTRGTLSTQAHHHVFKAKKTKNNWK